MLSTFRIFWIKSSSILFFSFLHYSSFVQESTIYCILRWIQVHNIVCGSPSHLNSCHPTKLEVISEDWPLGLTAITNRHKQSVFEMLKVTCGAIMSFLIDVFEYVLVVVRRCVPAFASAIPLKSTLDRIIRYERKKGYHSISIHFPNDFLLNRLELWMNGRMGVPVNKINEFESFSWEVFHSKWINFPISYWIETWLPDDFIIDSGKFSIWGNTFKWKFRMRMHNQFSSHLNQ